MTRKNHSLFDTQTVHITVMRRSYLICFKILNIYSDEMNQKKLVMETQEINTICLYQCFF